MDNSAIPLPTIRLAGYWRLQALDGRYEDKPVRIDTGWMKNVITDGGLDSIGTPSRDNGRTCVVGTGNTAAATTDTVLQAPVGRMVRAGGNIPRSTGVQTTGDRYGWERNVYTFAQGAIVGNIAEIGIGWNDSNTTPLFSRSLVSPVVPLISTDILVATYELRQYLPTTDATGSVTLDGISYNFTIRPMNALSGNSGGSNFGWAPSVLFGANGSVASWSPNVFTHAAPCVIGTIDSNAIQASGGGGAPLIGTLKTGTSEAYESPLYRCNFSFAWGITEGNHANGIGALQYSAQFGTYQCIFATAIPKTSAKQLSLRFRQTWARRP